MGFARAQPILRAGEGCAGEDFPREFGEDHGEEVCEVVVRAETVGAKAASPPLRAAPEKTF